MESSGKSSHNRTKHPYAQAFVHWIMLQLGIEITSEKERQIPRLIFGGVKLFVGKFSVGNPEEANVPLLKLFQIEKEIQDVFAKAGFNLFRKQKTFGLTLRK